MRWRCICVYQRTPTGWALRLIHPACPQHGGHPTWKVTPMTGSYTGGADDRR